MPSLLVSDRRIGGTGLTAVLGRWRRPGPAYVALADAVRRAVLAGDLPLSTRVPGERELAAALGVSRTTTSGAYGLLREQGYLRSRQGSGTVTALPDAPARPGLAPHPASPVPAGAGPAGVVDLTIAACGAPRDLRAAAERAVEALPRYAGHGYHPLGLDVLREAVADRYTARGTPTTPDQVLITTGAQHAIALLMRTHAGPGDRVVVEQPTYPHAIEAVRSVGARPVPVPTAPGGAVDLDLLESTVRQVAPRLVYLIPDHHNPTGASLDAAGRARVRDLARRTGTVVAGDEALTDLTLDGEPPAPWSGDGRAPRVVAVGSMSKSHWGGLRVGWLRGPVELVTRLSLARRSADLGTAVLDQLVAADLLRLGDGPLRERQDQLRARRDLLTGLLAERLPDWRWTVPPGGQSIWADLGAPVSSALSALALAHGVRVAPGPAFAVDGALEDRIRVPFTSEPDGLRRAVDGLALAWAALGRGAGATGTAGGVAAPAGLV
jgi:DNA-binding transcriptional MocR family regulator